MLHQPRADAERGARADRRLLPDGEFVGALAAAVATAERSVHVEFYIAALDATTEPFFDALRDAVGRGVTVRFLYDHLGSRKYPGHTRMNERLTADGVEWHRMMPIDPLRGRWRRPDLRNHRKLVVVDGRYTGEVDFYAAGPHKATAVRRLAEEEGYDLADCWAYSDSATDVPMLELVGHPTAVNPDRGLRRVAAERGTPGGGAAAPADSPTTWNGRCTGWPRMNGLRGRTRSRAVADPPTGTETCSGSSRKPSSSSLSLTVSRRCAGELPQFW